MLAFLDSILYSYAQIFFSNRRWLGGVILAGTFALPHLGLVALLGVTLANLSAYLLKFDETKIRSGFYGFNGILFGAAAAFYFELSLFLLPLIVLFIVITFFLSAVLEHLLASVFNLPGLSLPFVLTLYMFVIFLTNFSGLEAAMHQPAFPDVVAWLPNATVAYFKSLALILFQPDALVGALFAAALVLLSRVMFILSITGFLTADITLKLLFTDAHDAITILAGFNAILTAFALGGNLIIPSRKSFLLTVISSVLIVVLTGFFTKLLEPMRLPVLVLPFNFAVLTILYSLKFRREQSDLVLLYFQPGTPEENYYYHHNRLSRFERFKAVVPELPFFGEWHVTQGHNGAITHKEKWRHAWDFVVVDEQGKEFSGAGTALKDYYCYKLPIVAPLDGTVARVVDSVPNNPVGETNLKSNWGNTVILDHGNNVFSAASHLEPASIPVAVGARVRKGETIGLCGNSGRSPTPHLHFQFQQTDKMGDKTLEYPIGHYLERTEGAFLLHTFDTPAEGMRLQNVGMHKLVRRALDFKLGDKLTFSCERHGRHFTEEWEVKVDILNTVYIESSRNATVAVTTVGKVFYLTNFTGNRDSALYHFYLTAVQVPLAYEPNLVWTDSYPLSKLLSSPVRYISELFLLFSPQMYTKAEFSFAPKERENSEFVVTNIITVEGKGLFSAYRKMWNGTLTIDSEGSMKHITVRHPDGVLFTATAMILEEGKL